MTTAVLQPLHALSMPTTASAMADPYQDDHALPTPKLSSAEVDPQLEILQAMTHVSQVRLAQDLRLCRLKI